MSDDGVSGVTITRFCKEFLEDDCKQQIEKWRSQQQSINRNSWHIHFILEAYLVATRSLDAQTQCGCVLTKDNRIIGTGYNSFIGGINDNILPNLRPDKYTFMIHAEHNALLNCVKHGISTDGAVAYVTGRPCFNCFQFLYQAGVRTIYHGENQAIMSNSREAEMKFEILAYLMPKMEVYCVNLDDTTRQKIEKIRSCR